MFGGKSIYTYVLYNTILKNYNEVNINMASELLFEKVRALNKVNDSTKTISIPTEMLETSGFTPDAKDARVAQMRGRHGYFIAIMPNDKKE